MLELKLLDEEQLTISSAIAACRLRTCEIRHLQALVLFSDAAKVSGVCPSELKRDVISTISCVLYR